MKRFLIYAFILLSLLPFLKSDSIADIINGGFETGDFSGWNVRIDFGVPEFDPAGKPTPAGSAGVVQNYSFFSADIGGLNALYPEQGQYFAQLSIGSVAGQFKPIPGQYYLTCLQQEIYLKKGDFLTGKVAFYDGDFVPQDDAWVKIYKNSVEISNPFYAISGTPEAFGGGAVSLNGQQFYINYFEIWPSEADWADWSWIAPESSFYTLELSARSQGDNFLSTTVLFDAIQIPEPSTIVLIASGLLGIAVHARKKIKAN